MAVVVAGAGITGLAAALRLGQAGVDVIVVDPAIRIGGMVHTSPFAGRMVDEGADAFLVRTPAALDLARRVGLADELVHPARRDARVWLGGVPHRLPAHVLGVPTDPDEVEALRILSPDGLNRLRRDLTDPPELAPGGDVSVAEAVGGRLGPEALARLVDPLVGGISAGDTAKLSLAAVAPQINAAWRDPAHPSLVAACRAQLERAQEGGADPAAPIFASPVGGMVRLPQAVAHAARMTGYVDLRLGTALSAVAKGGLVALSDGTTVEAEGVIVATSGLTAAEIVGSVSPDARALLAGVHHVSVAFVRVAVRPADLARPLDGSGVLVPRTEGRIVTACSWASQKWDHLAPERGDGTEVVRAAVGRDGEQAVLDLDDDALVARVVDDLTPLLDLRGTPVAASLHRWPRAFPQYRPGHLDRVSAMEAALGRDAPEIVVAGMHLRGVGIPAAVASGEAAADRTLARLADR
ncbi:MAG TPA: protoporphyrinogen oxidase [Iamia sp.]|nr:protoporphyrinogen oxidase [Iamia sp.]